MAPRNEWAAQIRAAVGTIVTAIIILGATLLITSIQGHASDEDLTRIEQEAKARDAAMLRRLEEHLKEAQREALRQASFRGQVAGALKIELEVGEGP